MAGADKISAEEILRMTAQVVAAYVGNNSLSSAQLPDVIRTVHASLLSVQGSAGDGHAPAVSPKKSVTADYVVCLEDGRRMKMLKRHLRTDHNLTPDEYRSKWGLPPDHPLVAPNYSERRSNFAKKIGLGRNPGARKRRRK